jgi:hypothetical protein
LEIIMSTAAFDLIGPYQGSSCVFKPHTKGPPMSGLKFTGPSVQGPWNAAVFAGAAHRAWPASTAWYVARDTGQSVRTVEKHLRGEAKPGADALIAYLRSRHLGPRLREALHLNEGAGQD